MYYVYHLINPILNVPFYVGITNDPNTREIQHICIKGKHLVSRYISNMISMGCEPSLEVVFEVDSISKAREIEKQMVREYVLKYTMLNDNLLPRIKKKPKPRLYVDRSTTEKRKEHCGTNGLYCGIYYGEDYCERCRQYEMETRASVIRSLIFTDLYRAVINCSEWTRVSCQARRAGLSGIRVPDGNAAIVYCTGNPYRDRDMFQLVPMDYAINELTKPEFLFVTGGNRSTFGEWGL